MPRAKSNLPLLLSSHVKMQGAWRFLNRTNIIHYSRRINYSHSKFKWTTTELLTRRTLCPGPASNTTPKVENFFVLFYVIAK